MRQQFGSCRLRWSLGCVRDDHDWGVTAAPCIGINGCGDRRRWFCLPWSLPAKNLLCVRERRRMWRTNEHVVLIDQRRRKPEYGSERLGKVVASVDATANHVRKDRRERHDV